MLKASVSTDGIYVYSLSAGKSLPQFLEEAGSRQTSLRYNESFRKRLELVQDFEFPTASSSVKVSPDGCYIGACGIYPPEFKLYDTSELSVKFSRRFNSEIQDFLFLTEDYRKLAILQTNRELEFHSQGGRHHSMRIPRHGKCLEYVSESAVLYIAGSSPDIYRLNLELGEFDAPLESQSEFVSCCDYNPSLPILATGGSGGRVECWDVRERNRSDVPISSFIVSADASSFISSCRFSLDGMRFAAGTSEGEVKVYDIRNYKPVVTKPHRNSLPILSIQWIRPGNTNEESLLDEAVVSTDAKSIKFWNPSDSGRVYATIESPVDAYVADEQRVEGQNIGRASSATKRKRTRPLEIANEGVFAGAAVYPNSGLVFAPGELHRIGIYFIPSMGVAPRWCSQLDSLTEELEEANGVVRPDQPRAKNKLATAAAVYDDYEFVTREQLEQMEATELIGTPLVRAYMHGYFISSDMYRKLKTMFKPFDYESYRREQLKQKMEKKKPMRILLKQKKPKVNAALVEKLEQAIEDAKMRAAEEGGKVSKKQANQGARAADLLKDKRFGRLFTNPDFQIENPDADT